MRREWRKLNTKLEEDLDHESDRNVITLTSRNQEDNKARAERFAMEVSGGFQQ
jgi:hypothetical protein